MCEVNFDDTNYKFIIQIQLSPNYLLIFNGNKYNISTHIKLYCRVTIYIII